MKLIPVQGDPFQDDQQNQQSNLVPVQGDPFQPQDIVQNGESNSDNTSMLDSAKNFVFGVSENYPEFPHLPGIDIEKSDTPKGKLNRIKKQFPKITRDYDVHGNDLVVLNESIGGNPPDQRYYLNKPGISFNDIYDTGENLGRSVVPVATSFASAGMGAFPAMGYVGASGMISEAVRQTGGKLWNKQDYNPSKILFTGLTESIGEGAGRALSASLGAITNVFRRMKGSPKLSIEDIYNPKTGQLTDSAKEILDKKGVTPKELQQMTRQEIDRLVKPTNTTGLNSGQVKRFNEADELGVQPTTGYVTQDPRQIALEAKLKRTSANNDPRLLEREAINNQAITNQLDNIKNNIISTSDDAASSFEALIFKDDQLDSYADMFYKIAREKSGNKRIVRLGNTFNKLDDLAGDNAAGLFGGVVDAWTNAAKKSGVSLNENGNLVGKLSVKQAEALRMKANQLFKGANEQEKRALRSIKEGLDDDVLKYAGDDIFKYGRKTHEIRKKVYHSDEPAKKIVGDIIDGKIPPEQIFKKTVLSRDSRKVEQVKKALLLKTTTKDPNTSGILAWNDMRANSVKYIMDKASSGSKTSISGETLWDGAAFRKALDSDIGDKTLKILFSEKEIAYLYHISRVAENLSAKPNMSLATSGANYTGSLVDRVMSRVPGSAGRWLQGMLHQGANIAARSKDSVKITGALEPLKTIPKEASKRAKTILPQLGVFSGSVYNGMSSKKTGKRGTR